MGDETERNMALRNYAIIARRALHRGDVKENEISPRILAEIKRIEEEEQRQYKRCGRCGEPSIGTFCSFCEKEMKKEKEEFE